MRDAILFSGWTWEASNVPERISLALVRLGCRVLYCAAPVSILRRRPQPLRTVSAGIHSLQLMFVSSRLSSVPGCANLQATMLRRQIQTAAQELGLRNPLFFYTPLGKLFPLCTQMKRDHFVVHICMDHSGSEEYARQVEASDKTLALPKSSFHKFRAKFGEKVEIMPQSIDLARLSHPPNGGSRQSTIWASIPRPRLGYFSAPRNVLNFPLLGSVLESHPEWHFVSVGREKAVPLPNAHTIPWIGPEEFASCLQSFDIGFLPYNCYDEERLHIFPAKIFEYFAFGIPVVSTPLVHLWEYKDLLYFGDTAEELACAIEAALNEPLTSPKRAARIDIARKHSLENLAAALQETLPLESAAYSLAS